LAPNIRIDQSHCNYVLGNWLTKSGWNVVFRDPGRSSRGITGAQATTLAIFESRGWPIPDIVAISGQRAIIVEVDRQLSVVIPSLEEYRKNSGSILNLLGVAFPPNTPIRELTLAFCKTGSSSRPPTHLEAGLDAYFWFPEATTPSVIWRETSS
jgi:hypothetical protein